MGEVEAEAPALSEGASSLRRPRLHPTVFYGWGPTAREALERTAARLSEYLGDLPPFYVFLALEEQEEGIEVEVRVGSERKAVRETIPQPCVPSEVASEALSEAIQRVTEVGSNLQHGVFRGFESSFERVEVLTFAVLEEVEDFDALSVPLVKASSGLKGCWRVGVLWTAMRNASEADQERVTRNLECLDDVQVEVDGYTRRHAFEACFVLGPPAERGLRTVRRDDALDISASFLRYYLTSSVSDSIRRTLTPQPGPTRFYLGLVERAFDPREVVQSLRNRWQRGVHRVLAGEVEDALPETSFLSQLEPLAADVFTGETTRDVEARVEDAQRRVLRSIVAMQMGSGGDLSGLLPRMAAALQQELNVLTRMRNTWERECQVRYKRLRAWELAREPLREWADAKEVVVVRRRSEALLIGILALVLGWLAGAMGVPGATFLGVLAAVIGVGVFAAWPARETKRQAAGVQTNPDYARHLAEGERERDAWHVACAMVGRPKDREDVGDGGFGLVRLDLALTQHLVEVRRMHERLGGQAADVERSDSWFLRNVLSSDDLDTLFAQAIRDKSGEHPSSSEDRHIRALLSSRWGDSEMLGLFERGHESALANLEEVSRDLFAEFETMSLREAFDLRSRHQPTAQPVRAFFDQLFSGATLLWTTDPDELTAEYRFVVHSNPWDRGLVREGQKSIGGAELGQDGDHGRIAMIRIGRGSTWTV